MTTVAYRDGVLVSDSQATINGSRISQGVVQKLVKPPKGKSWKLLGKEIVCAGFAGQSSSIPWANKWLEEGVELLPPTGPKIAMISTLCLSADGEVFHWQYNITEKDQHPKHSVIAITGPAAIGSGAVFAESVMSIGASAEKAVKAAIKLDPFSGGDLQYFYLATLSERPPEREATKP